VGRQKLSEGVMLRDNPHNIYGQLLETAFAWLVKHRDHGSQCPANQISKGIKIENAKNTTHKWSCQMHR